MEKYQKLLVYVRYYQAILVTIGVVSSVGFPYIIYLILVKSPKMMSNTIKFNMIHVVTNSYVITMLIAISMPVEVVPMFAGFSAGITRNSGPESTSLLYGVILITFSNLTLNYVFGFICHYLVLKPDSILNKWLKHKVYIFLAYVGYSVLYDSILMASIFYVCEGFDEVGEIRCY
uniref:Uncharacterized protein n=1 Tax=Ditylenchus dipsaci TaxID=166011 RepID=A0A915DWM7_9BILA